MDSYSRVPRTVQDVNISETQFKFVHKYLNPMEVPSLGPSSDRSSVPSIGLVTGF